MADLQTLAPPDARTLFTRMRGRKILVVGDVMVDEWIWGTVTRISPEAPVPVVAVNDHSFTLGGAGNVTNNLRALEASVRFVGAVGEDAFAQTAVDLLENEGVASDSLVRVAGRPTTRKTRVVAHNQQVVRTDWESTAPLGERDRTRIADAVRAALPNADAVIVSDYAKGVIGRDVVAAALGAPIVVGDPKPENISAFAGVTCLAPNAAEAARASGVAIVDAASLRTAAQTLLANLAARYILITRGEHGMSLFGRDGEQIDVPAVARTVFDVSGAGDTVVAVLTLALAAGIPIDVATRLANFAAGAVVEKLGTATASAAEIVELVEHDGKR